MLINREKKFTDMRWSFVRILKSYELIRTFIQKLINKNLQHFNEIPQLINQAKFLKKKAQRKMHYYVELQLTQQVKQMLNTHLNNKNTHLKTYYIYSHLCCYLRLLQTKIKEIISINDKAPTPTSNFIKWRLFLSEINEFQSLIDAWIKESSPVSQQKNLLKTNKMDEISIKKIKLSTPSTAYISSNQSRVLAEVQQQKIPIKKHQFLKRCKTAKPQSKYLNKKMPYPISVRIPSAKLCINSKRQNSPFLKLTRNPKSAKKKVVFNPEPANKFEQSIEIIQLKDKSFQSQQNLNGSSVNQQSNQIIKKVPSLTQQKQSTCVIEVETQRLFKKSSKQIERRSSLKKLKKNHTQLFKAKPYYQDDAFQVIGEKNISCLLNDNDSSNDQTQKISMKNSIADHKDQKQNQYEKLLDIKSQKTCKFVKILTPKDLIQNQLCLSSEQKVQTESLNKLNSQGKILNDSDFKSNYSRMEILNKYQLFDKKSDCKYQQKDRKRKFFKRFLNQKFLADLESFNNQENQLQSEILAEINRNNEIKINDFYRELIKFKNEQIQSLKATSLGNESSFFIRQNKLREEKSKEFQNYLKKIKNQRNNNSEVFQVFSEQTSMKTYYYQVKERRSAFQADNQRIKNQIRTRQTDGNEKAVLAQRQCRNSQGMVQLEEI